MFLSFHQFSFEIEVKIEHEVKNQENEILDEDEMPDFTHNSKEDKIRN